MGLAPKMLKWELLGIASRTWVTYKEPTPDIESIMQWDVMQIVFYQC